RDMPCIFRQFSPVGLKLADLVSPGARPAKGGDRN
ncbi:hypothetical protein A2U01_0117521, partial [Trifolium medium]|nr:hypothetical protein [Trifolium medium]